MAVDVQTKWDELAKKKTERPDLEKIQRWLRGAASLLSVFGVTWVFGCLALDGSGTKVFAYLFVIFNGSQGVFIFVFHCALNDKVRREYRLMMRKMTWLPEPIQRCCLCVIMSKATVDFDFPSDAAQPGTLSTFQSTRIKSTSRHGLNQQPDQNQPKQQLQPSADQLNSRVQLSASQFSKPKVQSVLAVNQPIILPQVSSSPMNVSTSKRNLDGSAEKKSLEAD